MDGYLNTFLINVKQLLPEERVEFFNKLSEHAFIVEPYPHSGTAMGLVAYLHSTPDEFSEFMSAFKKCEYVNATNWHIVTNNMGQAFIEAFGCK